LKGVLLKGVLLKEFLLTKVLLKKVMLKEVRMKFLLNPPKQQLSRYYNAELAFRQLDVHCSTIYCQIMSELLGGILERKRWLFLDFHWR
jgi:hypothetical protein